LAEGGKYRDLIYELDILDFRFLFQFFVQITAILFTNIF